MVSRYVKLTTDDLDGTEGADTYTFAIEGVQYEIDLSPANAATFQRDFEKYVAAGRRLGRVQPAAQAASAPKGAGAARADAAAERQTNKELNKKIRAWAEKAGKQINERGRIAADVIEEYERAMRAAEGAAPAPAASLGAVADPSLLRGTPANGSNGNGVPQARAAQVAVPAAAFSSTAED